ncbi:MAG: ECF transporter S component [Clostridia bacterium]|nr:ECF transporter S component [Clostridia bacterium]
MSVNSRKNSIYRIALVGVFGALVFVSNYLSVPIPVAIGDVSRIHLGNIFCLLSGMVLGPVSGGLAAGIGSGLYDLTNPAYITSAPFTFAFKFVMAFLAGLIGKKMGKGKPVYNVCGGFVGEVAYIILYLARSFIKGVLAGSAPEAMVPTIITKLGTSSINAVIAIVCAVPLTAVVLLALKKSRLMDE